MADREKLISDISSPLRLRIDIRDNFLTDGSALSKSISAVGETIGYPVQLEGPDWITIWSSLSSFYSDANGPDIFVPSIQNVLTGLLDVLRAKLSEGETEDENGKSWTDKLLTATERARKLKLWVEVLEDLKYGRVRKRKASSPILVFDSERSGFVVLLPKKRLEAAVEQQLVPIRERFRRDLEGVFNPARETEKDAEWSDVESDGGHGAASSSSGADVFPTLASLPRPEILLKSTMPYILIMTSPVNTSIHISCSHHPSIRLIQAYVEKHARPHPNRSDKSKMVDVDPVVSDVAGPFGAKLYAGAVVKSYAWTWKSGTSAGVNGAWLMAFIEGVLGYKFVNQGDGAWVFRRDKRFAEEPEDAFD